ncbi:YhdP family protein [Pseudomarimonas arenosa]|uniref:TIGR02099 family protein n=1 Tax=Pseudomarimonas arenosa TaxID=2774145 RepID=A0AAW3ZLS0_9GAMM|nr:YhdP family protein [Pseudomarimonas arenosa]MBD8526996.1 TIGR02099 family protein [Pseudomarimonas arenosa]
MSRLRRALRRLRRWTTRALVLVIVLSGLLVAILSRILPWLEARPEQVEAWLSARLDEAVDIQRLRAEWNGRGVRLDIDGLRIGDAEGIAIDRAVVQLHAFTGWLPDQPLTSLHLLETHVQLERSEQGQWRVSGLLARRGSGEVDVSLLERIGELVLDRASLHVDDRASGHTWTLPHLDARLRTQGGRLRLGVNAYSGKSRPQSLIADFDLQGESGRLYLNLDVARASNWAGSWMAAHQWPDVALAGQLWVDIARRQVVSAQGSLDLGLLPPTLAEGESVVGPMQPASTPNMALQFALQNDHNGWQGWAQESGESGAWIRLSSHAGRRQVEASGWRVERLLPWLFRLPSEALPGLDEGQRQRWQLRAPRGDLSGLRMAWGGDQPLQIAALLQGVGIEASGNEPGFAALDLAVDGEGQRFAVQLHAADLAFDWPTSLRSVFHSSLRGEFMLWRDEQQHWCLSALDAAVHDAEFQIDVGGELCFNGGRPKVELSVEVAPAELVVAKRFWVINKMPPPAVSWLDDAIESGRLSRGRLLLSGDLDDWPFRNGDGRMEALADLEGLQLKYRRDWPAGTELTGWARFLNDSMEVELAGRVDGIEVERVTGGIDRYRRGLLDLNIQGKADTAAMMRLLRDTPLWAKLAPGLDKVRMQGPGSIDLALQVPLKKEGGSPRIDGRVKLLEADLRQPEWGLSFEGAQGVVEISERGARIEQLEVIHAGRPARFDLKVGSFVPDPANLVEAALTGRLDAEALLDTQPDLTWLRPYFEGNSLWRIDLGVPSDGVSAARLRLRSDLVGASLELPAPLRKSDAVSMPLDLQVELGKEQKSIDLALGELMRLRGSLSEDRPFNGVAEFGLDSGIERPARGLAVVGSVPVLDASGWMGLAGGGGGLIESVDLRCGELDIGGRSFSETEVRWNSTSTHSQLEFEGQGLQGEVEIPTAIEQFQRGITARFDRLYWPLNEQAKGAEAGIDPGLLPPLHVHVTDLRLGDAELGDTRLETFPDAGGMRIDLLQSRSSALELSARGFWHGTGEREYSQVDAEFVSLDLGAMLKALGFSALVEGGQTLSTLKARWPGPPSAFALEHAEGSLSLSVERGTIPEVRPGAGRVLGLLSLSEIPRRLALDFSDFFKSGLAFNKIEGEFVLAGGSAVTEGLRIDSPAAEIVIRGRTGLAARDYDQTMEVMPRASSVLPVVGALAAGPAGAAIGAVAQAVLQKPFKQMTRTLYSVKGSWEEPQIDIVERGPRRPAASEATDEQGGGISRPVP